MRIQLVSLVVESRSLPIVDSAGATSDCSTANERPPSDRKITMSVLLTLRPPGWVMAPVEGSAIVWDMSLRLCKQLLTLGY